MVLWREAQKSRFVIIIIFRTDNGKYGRQSGNDTSAAQAMAAAEQAMGGRSKQFQPKGKGRRSMKEGVDEQKDLTLSEVENTLVCCLLTSVDARAWCRDCCIRKCFRMQRWVLFSRR